MKVMTLGKYIPAVLVALLVAPACEHVLAEDTLMVIAATGMRAPGFEESVSLGPAVSGQFNPNGMISVWGSLTGNGFDSTKDFGTWIRSSTDFELLARSGAEAPGLGGGVHYASVRVFDFNERGEYLTYSRLSGSGVDATNDEAIWLNDPSGDVILIARTGSQAPDLESGVAYNGLRIPTLNANGDVLIRASVAGPSVSNSNSLGLWTHRGGETRLIVRTGDAAVGTSDGVVFGPTSLGSPNAIPMFNDLSQVFFSADLRGPGIDASNNRGFWLGSPEPLELVAREGDPAQGAARAVTGYLDQYGSVNSAGQIAIVGSWSEADGGSASRAVVWAGEPHSLAMVAQGGEFAPGLSSPATFVGYTSPLINAAGHVSFIAGLSGDEIDNDNDEGIWVGDGESLRLVAQEGQRAPGTSEGVVFGRDRSVGPFAPVLLNSAGRMAFIGYLRGDGVDNSNDRGIWAEDQFGSLQSIVRVGDTVTINTDSESPELRTISHVTITAPLQDVEGMRSGFNDYGQVLFTAYFQEGGSGLFLSNRVAIPESSALSSLAIGVCVLTVFHGWQRHLSGASVADRRT